MGTDGGGTKTLADSGVVKALLALWAVFQLWAVTVGTLDSVTLRACHCLFLLVFAFLLFPKVKKRYSWAADALFIAAAVASFGYIIFNYRGAAVSGGYLSRMDIVAAGVAIAVVFAAGWRACRSLAVLGAVFFLYNFLGAYIPGELGHAGFSLRRVLGHLVWGTGGIFGVGVGVSATYIFIFVLFGAFLQKSGFSELVNDLALTLVGRTAGGPAKISVLSSALFGMINGSAVANVATDGCITIPMMKKYGYRPEYAAAVEAAASTGGQFTPPVMGAVGFVMAEFLGVSYTKVMLAAAAPALLYYIALMCSVHFEAKRMGLSGLSAENIPNAMLVLKKRGHLLVPLAVLIIMLAFGFTPVYSCVAALISVPLAAALRKETRMSFADIAGAAASGAADAVSVGVCCIIIGVMIGTVSLTGVGLAFGNLVLSLAGGGKLLLCGVLAMAMCIVLGMGVPGIAAYVIVTPVVVPALLACGASEMAAHMFCLMYACLANITPPVAISSYVAAGIAGADQWKTSLCAVKLGAVGFLLPLAFLYNDALLVGAGSTAGETVRAVLTAAVGAAAMAAAFEGELHGRLGMAIRLLLAAAAVCCISVEPVTDVIGTAVFAAALIYQYKRVKE